MSWRPFMKPPHHTAVSNLICTIQAHIHSASWSRVKLWVQRAYAVCYGWHAEHQLTNGGGNLYLIFLLLFIFPNFISSISFYCCLGFIFLVDGFIHSICSKLIFLFFLLSHIRIRLFSIYSFCCPGSIIWNCFCRICSFLQICFLL